MVFKKKLWFFKDSLGPAEAKYSPAEIAGTALVLIAFAVIVIALMV
jgi:hypothetical protein